MALIQLTSQEIEKIKKDPDFLKMIGIKYDPNKPSEYLKLPADERLRGREDTEKAILEYGDVGAMTFLKDFMTKNKAALQALEKNLFGGLVKNPLGAKGAVASSNAQDKTQMKMNFMGIASVSIMILGQALTVNTMNVGKEDEEPTTESVTGAIGSILATPIKGAAGLAGAGVSRAKAKMGGLPMSFKDEMNISKHIPSYVAKYKGDNKLENLLISEMTTSFPQLTNEDFAHASDYSSRLVWCADDKITSTRKELAQADNKIMAFLNSPKFKKHIQSYTKDKSFATGKKVGEFLRNKIASPLGLTSGVEKLGAAPDAE